jgi:hypothetical protein
MNTETQQSTELPAEGEHQPVLENNPLRNLLNHAFDFDRRRTTSV